LRNVGKALGRVLLFLSLLVGVFLILPRETPQASGNWPDPSDDPIAVLAEREAAFDDISPGTEARVIWAGGEGQDTDWVVLYLHGFSATSEEIRPVPDLVAQALGANLVYARLRGHGRGGEALGAAMAGEWIDDTGFFLDTARAVGDSVLILGTSTGATLAAHALADPEQAEAVAGIAFISPNFRLSNPAGMLLEWPFARHWVPLLVGEERSFEPQNDQHAMFWTTQYASVAAVSMGTAMRATRARDYSGVTTPALFLFADADQVVSASATRDFAAEWGGPVTLAAQDLPSDGVDPYAHVIAGEILSPAMTEPVSQTILDWVLTLR